MLLAIDVGNTNIVLGVFDGAQLTESWRLQTLRERTADEMGILVSQLFAQSGVDKSRIQGIILSSVVPPLTGTMQEMAERYFGQVPLTVDPSTNTDADSLYAGVRRRRRPRRQRRGGVRDVRARRPRAHHRRRLRHGDDLRCDLCRWRVYRRRHLPGIGISADALFQRAARLPRVDVRKPPSIIGQTTVMQAGLFSVMSMVDGIVSESVQKLPGGNRAIALPPEYGGSAVERDDDDPAGRAGSDAPGLRLIWERRPAK
jgi:type III pantothenate kinase